MKRKFVLYFTIIGLIGLMAGCEKDGSKTTMLTDVKAPELISLPDLTLLRDNGLNVLTFVGKPVEPGFIASAAYTLESCESGTNFASPVTLISSVKADTLTITVSDLNGILIRNYGADVVISLDFRLRSVLVVDGGTGAPGTGENTFQYISASKTAEVTTYGLPRLDLIGSGVDQKIESALGNGIYAGYVKLTVGSDFTLKNPDTQISYGGAGGTLTEDGPSIVVPANGWHAMTANINTGALSYDIQAYMIGIIGSATPTGWDSDTDLDYDAATGTWHITMDLIGGQYIKFRKNDGWAWNLGGDLTSLTQGGADILIAEDGNYTMTLTIINDSTGSVSIVKN